MNMSFIVDEKKKLSDELDGVVKELSNSQDLFHFVCKLTSKLAAV
jgi:hypothetical protein